MKRWTLCIVFVVATFASDAKPCSQFILDIESDGPGTWSRASEIPSNWAFVNKQVPVDGISWWSRQLPNGEPSRLNIETLDGMVRVFPSSPAEVGQEYELFSVRDDAPTLRPADALSMASTRAVFVIREPDFEAPNRLTISSARVVERSYTPSPLDFIFEDSCGRRPAENYSKALVAVIVEPGSAVVVLRDASTDALLDAVILGPDETTALVYGRKEQDSTALNYQVEVYDYAGNVSAKSGAIVIDRSGACSSNTVTPNRPVTGALIAFFMFAFSFLRPRRSRRQHVGT